MKKMLSLLATVVLMFQTMMPINAWFAVDVQAFKNATSENDTGDIEESSDTAMPIIEGVFNDAPVNFGLTSDKLINFLGGGDILLDPMNSDGE
ncbi:MAG: hypothetical protein LBI53_05555 [Candidatus Peribacteria bacterium]|jgi:hypothetical protein|nr:hypothetical protein [Candidatus Peribacteria bacterium]